MKQDYIKELLSQAKAAGVEAAEAYLSESESFSAMRNNGALEDYQSNHTRGLGFRGLVNGRMGYASTEALDDESIGQLIRGVIESATLCESKDEQPLYQGGGQLPEVALYNPELDKVSPEAKLAKIEAMENRLQETARVSKQELLRVGILSSVAAQWMPEILETFYQVYPEVVVKLENEPYYLTGELGVKEHKLDCCFFAGRCPSGLEALPLYEDLYYLVVGADSELANLQEASIWDMVDKYQFIPTNESTDTGSAIHEIYQQFAQSSHLDFQPQENQMAIGLVEKGMGITVLPGLALLDLIPNRAVKVIPLKEKLARTVSLLCPRESERSQLTNVFLRLTRQQVEQWKQEQKTKRPWLQ